MNYQLGVKGEQIAVEYLRNKGFKIKNKNWRFKHKEIDIIAEIDDFLVFVEVKSRSTDFFENPQDAITKSKIRFILEAAEAYIMKHDINTESRFDVIAIIQHGKTYKIEHIPDAFNSLI